MPIIKSSSDLQRSFKEIDRLAHETLEPIYITKNGESNLVVMDAGAFDDALDLQRRVYEREMRVYEAFLRSEEDVAAGRVRSLDDVVRRRKDLHPEERDAA